MRVVLGLLLLVSFHTHAAPLEGFSLMFQEGEIKESVELQESQSFEKTVLNGLFLGGIIYSSPKSWVVWLNGKRYGAGESSQGIEFQKVTPSSVELIWEYEGKHHTVVLSTNQTYDPQTGDSHCGDCRSRG